MTQKKPVWTEGLFITQHHLQQLDRYHESYVNERLRSAITYEWGVRELTIDERALAQGQVRVTELKAVFPDGTPIACGAELEDAPPPRQVDTAFAANLPSLSVYVAIPHEFDNTGNVELEARPATTTRFTRLTRRVSDFNSGGSEQELPWARPNLRLLIGDERREAFDAIQIAELVRDRAGAIALKDTFVPPVMRIEAAPFLMSGFRRLLGAMTSRQRSLAATRRQRTEAAVEFQAADAAKFWLLNALNESIPTFTHLVDHGDAHPEDAYLELATLIGRLCTFAVDGDPTAIPKFNYLALGETFEPMFARTLALLDAVIAERYFEIPLHLREDGMYLGKIEEPNLLRYEFFVAATGKLGEAELRERLPKLSKIASWGQIGPLLNSAVNGARIELEYRPPGALPVRPGMYFFRLQKTPEYWPDIQGTGTIALYHPLPRESVTLTLYAVDPRNL